MTRAELAAEVLRIHGLIATEPEPASPEEWDRIVAALHKAAGTAGGFKEEPQPRMVDGFGLCSIHCPHYESERWDSVARCRKADVATFGSVPCRPWAQARTEEADREIRDLRQELATERQERRRAQGVASEHQSTRT